MLDFKYVMSFKDDAVTTDVLGDFHPSQNFQIDLVLLIYRGHPKIQSIILTTE